MQTNLSRETPAKDASLAKLEECFRRELSAVETYEFAMKGIEHVGLHRTFQEILNSHIRRTELLRDKIGWLGAEPPKSSGIWGAFAKAIQAGADLLGDRTAVAALEEGEDLGLKLYTEGLSDCDAKTRTFIQTELLPRQQHTHELCRSLKNYMKAPS